MKVDGVALKAQTVENGVHHCAPMFGRVTGVEGRTELGYMRNATPLAETDPPPHAASVAGVFVLGGALGRAASLRCVAATLVREQPRTNFRNVVEPSHAEPDYRESGMFQPCDGARRALQCSRDRFAVYKSSGD